MYPEAYCEKASFALAGFNIVMTIWPRSTGVELPGDAFWKWAFMTNRFDDLRMSEPRRTAADGRSGADGIDPYF
ncbi:MAG: hypothetical protein ACLTSZ_09045 [Lachnospiraceae bacterium]